MMGNNTSAAIVGTTQNHQNSAQIIAFPSVPTMRALPIQMEALFDVNGRHLGNVYDPLIVDGALTAAHAGCLSTRPANRLVWWDGACPEPRQRMGLVWMLPMLPPDANPLAHCPAVLPYLVYALDNGLSVKLHAATEDAIDATCAAVSSLLGGGHA